MKKKMISPELMSHHKTALSSSLGDGLIVGKKGWRSVWQAAFWPVTLGWVTFKIVKLNQKSLDEISEADPEKVWWFTKSYFRREEYWIVLWTKLCALALKWGWVEGTSHFSKWRLAECGWNWSPAWITDQVGEQGSA